MAPRNSAIAASGSIGASSLTPTAPSMPSTSHCTVATTGPNSQTTRRNGAASTSATRLGRRIATVFGRISQKISTTSVVAMVPSTTPRVPNKPMAMLVARPEATIWVSVVPSRMAPSMRALRERRRLTRAARLLPSASS